MDITVRNYSFIKLFTILIAVLGVATVSLADKTKSALKALEKGEYEKVEELILKSLEKDSINPGSKYVYSKLYSTTGFSRYNVDSAHFFILRAQSEFTNLDDKEKESLIKDEVTEVHLSTQHAIVDSLAYAISLDKNSLEGYNYFILNYTSSVQYEEVVKLRNTVAYKLAADEGSWQAYKSFMDTYPEAQELDQATKEYNRLIFEEKTRSGKKDDIEAFLNNHPETPYRQKLEEKVFNDLTTFGECDGLVEFIEKHDNPALQKKALNMLYYLDANNEAYIRLLKSKSWKLYQDSLKVLEEVNEAVLVPYLAEDKYGFANLQGDMLIDYMFEEISPRYYCGNIKDDVLDVTLNKTHLLVNRKLDTVYIGKFNKVTHLGAGVLVIKKDGAVGAMHKTGFQILPSKYQEISMLSPNLLKTKKSGKFGVSSIFGKEVITPKYDNVYITGKYLIIELEGRVSVNLVSDFIVEGKKNNSFVPKFKYEEFETIGKHVICFDGDNEVLLDSLLNEVVPPGQQRINTKSDIWVIKQPDGYRLFDKKTEKLQEEFYSDVVQNDRWIAMVVGNKKWSVYSKPLGDAPIVGLDSVKLLGEDIAMVFRGENGTAIFPNKKVVEFSKNEKLRSIGSGKNTNVHFLVISRNGKNILYRDGERVIESVYEIGYISDEVFSAKSKDEYGAMDTETRLIMRIRYDAIGEAEKGIAPVLYNGRFGAYNFNNRVLISLKFDEKLKPYNDQLLITKSRGKKGLYNIENENILDNEYDEILYWTDSVALVKSTEEWALYDIYSNKALFSGMLDFEYVSKRGQNTIIKYRTKTGMGVYSMKNGELFEPTFNDIINLGTEEVPFYLCEKSIREAGYYVAVYKNSTGETVRTQAYREEEYQRIVCEK
ncbi:WG repeat-containing protein [Reichenbachiella sp. MALMAid0571]|uniref:WG repeat-containing protein n=1 Tax=Reichenbachiella sp. MALMAid0571 TaxID=3143939 RepID=UPI0032DE318D